MTSPDEPADLAAVEAAMATLPLSDHCCADQSMSCEKCSDEFAVACQTRTGIALSLCAEVRRLRGWRDAVVAALDKGCPDWREETDDVPAAVAGVIGEMGGAWSDVTRLRAALGAIVSGGGAWEKQVAQCALTW